MATYPEGNPGRFPLDPLTKVGQFRLLYGDTTAEPYVPETPGFGNYDELSDDEIQAFIDQGGGSLPQGVAWLYLAMAGRAAASAKNIKDHDLAINTEKRAAELRSIAQMWFDRASEAEDEYFDIVPIGDNSPGFVAEGTLPVWGREYTIGRWR